MITFLCFLSSTPYTTQNSISNSVFNNFLFLTPHLFINTCKRQFLCRKCKGNSPTRSLSNPTGEVPQEPTACHSSQQGAPCHPNMAAACWTPSSCLAWAQLTSLILEIFSPTEGEK